MNVAEFLITIIQGLGTESAFCLTGGMAMHINRAAAESGLRMVYCNHEQAVAAAADGYAKACEFRVPGLAIVTAGPGVTNTITSVASSYYDSVPLYILAGQVKTADINKHGVRSYGAQETPQLDLMHAVTKYAFRYIPHEIDDASLASNMAQALQGRKGPVFIEVPLDLQAKPVEDGPQRVKNIIAAIKNLALHDGKDMPAAGTAIAALRSDLPVARQPVLVIGNGTRIAGVQRDKIRALVELLGLPTLLTSASFDLLPFDHDLNFGCAGGLASTHANRILQSGDFVLFLGARLDMLTTAFNPNNYGRSARRLVVEIDTAEISKNAGMSNTDFFEENVANVIDKLLQGIILPNADANWLPQCREWRQADRHMENEVFGDRSLITYQVARQLSQSQYARYLVPTASGYACEGIARFYRPAEGATFAWAGHVLGSMGLGLPAAIGASTALNAPVVCLEGDGGILLNIQELFTIAANQDLQITIIIMNNGGYQSIIKSQSRAFNNEYGASSRSGLADPNFSALAALAGLPYYHCAAVEEFKQILNNGTTRRFIELAIEEDGYRGPSVTTKFDKDGKPYSTDIGDVSWER
jgi:acetolactate synthase-1/2/3 large subunit